MSTRTYYMPPAFMLRPGDVLGADSTVAVRRVVVPAPAHPNFETVTVFFTNGYVLRFPRGERIVVQHPINPYELVMN